MSEYSELESQRGEGVPEQLQQTKLGVREWFGGLAVSLSCNVVALTAITIVSEAIHHPIESPLATGISTAVSTPPMLKYIFRER